MIVSAKKDYSWNPGTCTCEDSKYLKRIADTSVIMCDEITSVMDLVSTKMTNNISTNVTKNCHSKKIKISLCFAYSFFTDYITADNYYYLLSLCEARVKTKKYW